MGKRILFLTPQMPYPPQQGTAIRNYNLMAQVASRHEVHLLSFAENPPSREQLGALGKVCATVRSVQAPIRTRLGRVWALATSSLPDIAFRLDSPAFRQELQSVLRELQPDVVQLEGLEMAAYGTLTTSAAPATRLVYDGHNAEYLLQKRIFQADAKRPGRWPGAAYSLLQWKRLQRYEADTCRNVSHVIACSASDAAALQEIAPGVLPIIVPNGVDTELFRPGVVPAMQLGVQAMVFTGKMDFRPNVDAMLWFAQSVLPLIRERSPSAHLYVVGKNPHARLAALRANPGVTLTGYVEDVRPYVRGAAVYVVPLLTGGGTRLKVLEAMAMAKALVTTALGCEGIDAEPGRDLVVADNPGAFAEQVLALFSDEARAARLGQAARDFVVAHFDWRSVTRQLDVVYDA
jgi:sugar transferase (PEP-CTERM/EpsH1 system associated)